MALRKENRDFQTILSTWHELEVSIVQLCEIHAENESVDRVETSKRAFTFGNEMKNCELCRRNQAKKNMEMNRKITCS
jgi:hypothetical protein